MVEVEWIEVRGGETVMGKRKRYGDAQVVEGEEEEEYIIGEAKRWNA
jgi:hypothetical protein